MFTDHQHSWYCLYRINVSIYIRTVSVKTMQTIYGHPKINSPSQMLIVAIHFIHRSVLSIIPTTAKNSVHFLLKEFHCHWYRNSQHKSGIVIRIMMTSWNGNIFRVTGPLCGEFTGHRWIPPQRPMTRSFDVSLICDWINGWVNNREAGD